MVSVYMCYVKSQFLLFFTKVYIKYITNCVQKMYCFNVYVFDIIKNMFLY